MELRKQNRAKVIAIIIGLLLLSEAALARLDRSQQGHDAKTGPESAVKECEPTPEAARGKELYLQNCARCHGSDGRGETPLGRRLQASDLTDPEWQWEMSDRRIAEVITNGEERMPAFGRKLSAEDVALVVAHVRTLRAKRPRATASK
ncbi:c-type cytochrome [Pyrinomonas sp.]|uniref:c-type cytochrome n=1 Tax=Pyrinomonas sp. TaxID=2080306 RepID=UPI0033226520